MTKDKEKDKAKDKAREEQRKQGSFFVRMRRGRWRVKLLIFGIILVTIGYGIFSIRSNKGKKITSKDVVTASKLSEAVNISQLSTADFTYNGVAEKYKDDGSGDVECHIAYEASVKVGVDMDDIKFSVDEKDKSVQVYLPKIKINIVDVKTDGLSYLPEDPDIELPEILKICNEDVTKEANQSEELYQTAEENLKISIQALLKPILDDSGYSIAWSEEKEEA